MKTFAIPENFWIQERKPAVNGKPRDERPYQIGIIADIPVRLVMYEHIIVQSPTGSGKSHIINETVKKILKAGKTALVLSDNLTIHYQLLTECAGHTIESKIKFLHIMTGQCYVAMTQSLGRRDAIVDQFKNLPPGNLVIIVDEAHRNTMTPLIKEINPKWLIGFTATPHYRWAKHLPELYKGIIVGPQIGFLIENKYLAHYTHTIRTAANLTELKIKNGEFTEESQNKVFGSRQMYDGIFEDLPNFKFNKCVVYVASIKLCEELYEEFIKHGYKATAYHSKRTDADLEKFTEGDCNVCVSVSSLTLGWDFPPIDLIILWRSTTSMVLYLQMGGRGGRIIPGVKEHFNVLDYGGNFERFGAWSMDRDWEVLWKAPPKKRVINTYAGVAGSKECPVCHMLLPVASRSCDNCGYIYPESEMKLIEGELLEVQNTIKSLDGRFVADFSVKELYIYAMELNRKQHAIRIARRMEQEKPGFLKEFALAMGYKEEWLRYQLSTIPTDGTKINFFNSKVKVKI